MITLTVDYRIDIDLAKDVVSDPSCDQVDILCIGMRENDIVLAIVR